MATDIALPVEHASIDAPAEAEAFEDWLISDLAKRGKACVLVVSPWPIDRVRIPAAIALTTLCQPRGERGDAATRVELGLRSGSFDAVYLYEMTGIAVDPKWPDRAHRMLKPGGRIVVAVEPSEFSFAPLPAGGDARLLARTLTEAGFRSVEIVRRTARLIIAAAQRPAGDRGG